MKRILITGAGGFIGGRLVEILKENSNTEINILLRNIAKAARISRYHLNYFKGSIVDEASVESAMKGCDVVVHCAHDFSNPDANLKAAELIARQCLQQGVGKMIYISSFAVHKTNTGEIIDEESPTNDAWEYANNKIAIEKDLIEFYKTDGLPVIILRPTIVYGPFSAAWTIHPVNQMIAGRIVLPYMGSRICNAVYIDDVVQAIIKAINANDSAHGKYYLVSGNDTVTWKEFYESHLTCRGTNQPVYMSEEESEKWQGKYNSGESLERRTSILKDPITVLKKTPVYTVYQRLLKKSSLKKRLLSAKKNIPRPLIYLDKDAFETHSCAGKASISKIANELNYKPGTSFHEGIKKTRLWIDWANLNLE